MLSEIIKGNSFYPRARAAALSLVGRDRFYNPLSAMLRFDSRRSFTQAQMLQAIRAIRTENGLTIWQTPSGELATIETEIAEHIAFLLAEFEADVYSSAQAPLKPGAIVLDVGANIG